MMRWIVESSLKLRLIVVAAAAAMIVVGIAKLGKTPVDVLPEFAPVTVEVQTEALGLSPAEVEQLITVPIEQDLLNGIAFLDDIRSQSVQGLSRILLVFEPGTDLFVARQVVSERLTQAHALPNVSKPPRMLQPVSSTNRAMMIGVSSKSVSAIEMSLLARWTIVPRLTGETGVANVSVWGQRDRQLQVQVDPERLRDRGVSLLQVIQTAGNSLWVSPLTFLEASTPGTGGFIETSSQRLGIQHISPITKAEDLARVSVEGTPLRLGDVANVVEDHQPLIGDALTNDGAGLLLVVEKLPNANALDVTRRVEEAIAVMKPGLKDIEFDTGVFRPATYIEKSIDNITTMLIVSSILGVLLLGALLLRWRTALVSLVAIPLSVLAAALVLYALGKSMNAIVFLGLVAALGFVIDDAIASVENIARRLRRHRQEGDPKSTAAVILEASLEERGPTVYAALIIALTTLPVFFLERVSGAFFPDLAVAYLLAMLAAMAVAVTLTPALCLLLFSRGLPDQGESPVVRWLQRVYGVALSQVLRRPRPAFVAAVAVVVAAICSMPFLGHTVLPSFKENQLLIHWDAPPGTSLPEMNRVTALAARELRSVPGVEDVGAHVGRAVTADQIVGVNSGELWVSIDPDADYDATVASVKSVVAGYPGLTHDIQTFSSERVGEALTGVRDDLVVRVYGEELPTLRSTAEDVKQMLSGVDGVRNARVESPRDLEPTLQIEVNLAAAQRHRIKPGDVRRAAATLLSGIQVGSLFEDQKVFDVVVWGTPDTRSSLTSIRQLLIDTPDGGHVRLGEVADVRIAPSPTVIQRQGVARIVDVAASISGRDRGSVVRDVKRGLSASTFPLEYHAEVLGVDRQPSGRLISLGVAAAIGILLLLQACFGSWRLAALAFGILPVAVAGGVLAALAAGGSLTFGSYIGLLAVLGLAARNTVALVDRLRRLEATGGEAVGPALVLRGTRERVGPVLATALVTGLVLLPVAIVGSVAGLETVHPLAIVVLGGLITSTFATLFVVPVLYLRVTHRPAPAEGAAAEAFTATLRRRITRQRRVKEPVLRGETETGLEPSS
jgi:CzcA family heavy metal efflux pump